MTTETIIKDCKGNAVIVGSRVLDENGVEEGTVTWTTEPDGDYNDETQRAEAYGPYVYVLYDDGQDDRYTARQSWSYSDDRFVCDDIEVAS
jgi:hypothetical protein